MSPHRLALSVVGVAVALGGCGGGARYANQPSPPQPTVVSAAITASGVNISPDHSGSGLVRLVITNLTGASQQLVLRSAGGGSFQQQTAPINPQDTAELKAQLGTGRYTVKVKTGSLRGANLAVEAGRAVAQNPLVLP